MYLSDIKNLQGSNRVIPAIDDFLNGIQTAGLRVELGCGKNKMSEYFGIDLFSDPAVDLVLDIDGQPLPFASNSVYIIRAVHVLEHIQDVTKLWNEMFRICKPGAYIYAVVPHPMGPWYFQDPTHKSFYTEKTFLKYFDGEFVNSYSDYGFIGSIKPLSVFIHGATFDKLAVHAVLEVIK